MKIITLALLLAGASVVAQENYTLRVLTFEDAEGETKWSSLIDTKQYGGPLLYGPEGMGFDNPNDAYKWTDTANTLLSSGISSGWGMWCFWSGGHAVSNYGSKNFTVYGSYDSQLTVYNPAGTNEISMTGNGHNGSDNFCIHYGYSDGSGYSQPESALPTLSFSDGVARVIDHMWVNNICYAINCYLEGNGLTAKIGEGDWVKIVATGFNEAGASTGTAELFLCDGPDNIVTGWTRFDLSGLGEVKSVRFNITGSSDNGAGFSQPAYFAFDDVAVRFPETSGIIEIEEDKADDGVYYDLTGRSVNNPTKGIYIHNGKKIFIR